MSIFVQNLKSMALLVENELKLPIELRTKYGLTEKMIEVKYKLNLIEF